MYKTYIRGQGWVRTLNPMTDQEIIAQQRLVAAVACSREEDEVQWHEEEQSRALLDT